MSTLPWIETHGIGDLPIRLAELAGAIHSVPVDVLPDALPRPATGDAMGEQIARWKSSADAHVEDLPIFRYVAAWLDAHRPPPVPLGLVHHDFSTANMLVDDNGDLIIIDWELACIGDPREDLGYFKAYAQAAPPDLIDADVDGFCNRYREITGYGEDQLNPAVMTYFLVLGRDRRGRPAPQRRRSDGPGRDQLDQHRVQHGQHLVRPGRLDGRHRSARGRIRRRQLMLARPSTDQVLEAIANDLRDVVAPACTDDRATVLLGQVDQLLRRLARRAAHEIAWMHEEMAAIDAAVDGDTDPATAEALAAFRAAPTDSLHLADVLDRYSLASECAQLRDRSRTGRRRHRRASPNSGHCSMRGSPPR